MGKRLRPGQEAARQRDWIMIRIRRTTHHYLRELAERWLEARDKGKSVPEPETEDGYSLDQVVRELLSRDAAHRARSSRSITRARQGQGRQGRADDQVVGQGPQQPS